MIIPEFKEVFITVEGSKGEYIYDGCLICEGDCAHETLVCRNCGYPPNCACDIDDLDGARYAVEDSRY